jgi:hypothetical protein
MLFVIHGRPEYPDNRPGVVKPGREFIQPGGHVLP